MKKWTIHKVPEENARALEQGSDLTTLAARVLASRGFTSVEQAAEFLSCSDLADPFLTADMESAVQCLNAAIEAGTKICVYGDYDCDGITATAILYTYLSSIGGDVTFRIPERAEGYGLNAQAVQEMHDEGVELIVTVDNGITAVEEANLIYDLGMRLVITDHHEPLDTLPRAEAIVDPHRADDTSPYHQLCGAGLALKLVAAMEGGDYTFAMEQFGDFVAIATVADVVELSGENRYLVRHGMRYLAQTEKPGLLALMKNAGLEGKTLTSDSIAYGLAPRINASGRFGTPMDAFFLLMSEDPDESRELANRLEKCNTARKAEEQRILQEIAAQVEANPMLLHERVLVFAGEGWHHGVIGIVAARLEEKFGKPAILISIEEDGARGSMRSFGAFSAFKCLDAAKAHLTRYGGHPGAGGFSLEPEQIEPFRQAVQDYAREMFPEMPVYGIDVDLVLRPEDITVQNIVGLSVLEPFGAGNPSPVFALPHAVLQEIVPLSKGAHSKLLVQYSQRSMELLLFRVKPEQVGLKSGDVCDFLVTAQTNTFRGKVSISMIVQDYRKSGITQSKYFSGISAYEHICRNESLPQAYYDAAVPSREELTALYKHIPSRLVPTDWLYRYVMELPGMNYCKFLLSLDIFAELDLITHEIWEDRVARKQVDHKVNLQDSALLRRLQAL